MATLTSPATFPSSLPAWRDPSLSGELGHAVSDVAPAGVIDAGGLAGRGAPGVPVPRVLDVDLTVATTPPSIPQAQRGARGAPPATVSRAVSPSVDSTEPIDSPAPLADAGVEPEPVEATVPGHLQAAGVAPDQPVPGAAPSSSPRWAATLPHAPSLQRTVTRPAPAAGTRTPLTTSATAGLPVVRPRVVADVPRAPVLARGASDGPAETTEAPPAEGQDATTRPIVSRATAPPAGTTTRSAAAPTTTRTATSSAAGPAPEPAEGTTPVVARAVLRPESTPEPTPHPTPHLNPQLNSEPNSEPLPETPAPTSGDLGVTPASEAAASAVQSAPHLAGGDLGANRPGDSSLLGSTTTPSPFVQRATGAVAPSLGGGPATEVAAPTVRMSAAPAAGPAPGSTPPAARAGLGPPLASAPPTMSDLPAPVVQRVAATTASPGPVRTHPDATTPAPAHDLSPAEAAAGAQGHTEVDLPTVVDRTDAQAASGPWLSPLGPGTRPVRTYDVLPAPMPVVSRFATAAPLGPMTTSLSRSSALTGPGMPSQTLEVRPARTLLPAPPPVPVAVSLQRVAPTDTAGQLLALGDGPPSSAFPADPPAGGVEPALPVQRSRAAEVDVPSPLQPAGLPEQVVEQGDPTVVPTPAPPEGQSTTTQDLLGATTAVAAPSAVAPSGPPQAAGTTGATAVPSGDQLEALAQRLTQPLLRRITSQLLVDRERRGLRTDRW